MRKMKTVRIKDIRYDINGESLSSVINELTQLNIQYSTDYEKLFVDVNSGIDGSPQVELYGKRLETDSEFVSRMNAAKSNQVEKEEFEKILLAQLKAKYEGWNEK